MKPLRQPTVFEQKVYAALLKIPVGKVVTYKILGQALKCNSAQAIGQALKRNPQAPTVPCHRVIRSDLTLGGYQGKISASTSSPKRRLLEKENVFFDRQGKLLSASLLTKL